MRSLRTKRVGVRDRRGAVTDDVRLRNGVRKKQDPPEGRAPDPATMTNTSRVLGGLVFVFGKSEIVAMTNTLDIGVGRGVPVRPNSDNLANGAGA